MFIATFPQPFPMDNKQPEIINRSHNTQPITQKEEEGEEEEEEERTVKRGGGWREGGGKWSGRGVEALLTC